MATQTEQLLEQITKLPTPQKVGVIVALVVALTAANWYFFIDPTEIEFNARLERMNKLEQDLIQNQAIANNLPQYRAAKAALEEKLRRALTKMPEQANIEAIVQSFFELGAKSGLVINIIEPKPEVNAQFYAEIPISLSVVGNYNEVAVFFDAVSRLKRIVNVKDVKLTNPVLKDKQWVVGASFVATTFRFLPAPK